jgi:hypothetical protein
MHKGIRQPIVVKEIVGTNRGQSPAVKVGDFYPSIKAASDATGIGRTHIVSHLTGSVRHAKGIIFDYAGDPSE